MQVNIIASLDNRLRVRGEIPIAWSSLCMGHEVLKHACEQKKAYSAGRLFWTGM